MAYSYLLRACARMALLFLARCVPAMLCGQIGRHINADFRSVFLVDQAQGISRLRQGSDTEAEQWSASQLQGSDTDAAFECAHH
jgi:hypothetical protein